MLIIDRLKEKSEKGNYKSEHKKLNKSFVCRTHPLTTSSNAASPIIDKRLCNYMALIQNNVIRMENDVTAACSCPTDDYRGFPYYRSNDCFHDHVLMKDVAVSCTLLELKSNQNILTSTIDKYFLKQIKNEYEEFSKYLQNLSKKYKTRPLNFEKIGKQPVATEYVDKNGSICLRLRLNDFQSNGIKEESTVQNIISVFFSSWNFLFPVKQRKENVKESHQRNCLYVHKNKYRKVKKNSLSNQKNSKLEINSKSDTLSSTPKYKKCYCCHKTQEFSIQKSKNSQRKKMEKWTTECVASAFNLYAPNKKMQAINIRIIKRQQRNL